MKGDRDEAPIWVYKDGPAFERLCPNCGRFMKMPATINWRESLHGICTFDKIKCSRCGPVEPNHVGWDGDFDSMPMCSAILSRDDARRE